MTELKMEQKSNICILRVWESQVSVKILLFESHSKVNSWKDISWKKKYRYSITIPLTMRKIQSKQNWYSRYSQMLLKLKRQTIAVLGDMKKVELSIATVLLLWRTLMPKATLKQKEGI